MCRLLRLCCYIAPLSRYIESTPVVHSFKWLLEFWWGIKGDIADRKFSLSIFEIKIDTVISSKFHFFRNHSVYFSNRSRLLSIFIALFFYVISNYFLLIESINYGSCLNCLRKFVRLGITGRNFVQTLLN